MGQDETKNGAGRADNYGKTRVLIIDDEPLFRELLGLFLSRNERAEVVGVVSDAEEAAKVAEAARPDVVLLDSGPDCLATARSLKAADPAVGIVMLVADEDRERVARVAVKRPAWSSLLKRNIRDAAALLRAIDGAAWGLITTDPALVAPPAQRQTQVLERLTLLQLAVLRDMAAGCSDDALAARHGLSGQRLEQVVSSIYRDIHVRPDRREDQRVQAVLKYLSETTRVSLD